VPWRQVTVAAQSEADAERFRRLGVPAGAVVFVGTVWLLGAPEISEFRGKFFTAETAKNAEKTE